MSKINIKSVACSLCILNTLTFTSSFNEGGVPSHVLRSPRPKYLRNLRRIVVIHEFGGPSVLQVSKASIPNITKHEVLVKVYAAGINPIDVYVRQNAFGFIPKLPFIIGKEAAGEIVKVDSEVKTFKPGDRVVCCLPYDGGYSEYVVCNASNLVRLPHKLSYAQGAGIYVAYFTAYRSLVTKSNVQKGDVVLVHGASGAVGIAAVQIAKAKGATVIGTVGTDFGRDIVDEMADFVVNHREDDHLEKALKLSGKSGFDIVIESRACSNLYSDMRFLRPGGKIAIVGTVGNNCRVNPRTLINNEGSFFGIKMTSITEEEFRECAQALEKGMEEGWVFPIIGKEYKLDEARQAHIDLMNNPGAGGKLVFVLEH